MIVEPFMKNKNWIHPSICSQKLNDQLITICLWNYVFKIQLTINPA